MDRDADPESSRAPALDRLRAAPTWAWVVGFTAYSYVATTVCAAWFLRRAVEARGGELDVARSLMWSGAVYGLWLPVAVLTAWMLGRFGAGARGLVALGLAGLVIVPATASASVWIDGLFSGDASDWMERAVERAPVAILLYTAIVAFGMAAAHRSRAVAERSRSRVLEGLLEGAREAARHTSEPPVRLMVAVGSRRAPVALDEVEWFAAAGNYVVVHWGEREGLVRETLRALEARLDPAVFARSHRSTLVNLARVREARSLSDGSWRLTMASGAELVASRTHRDALMHRLGR